MKTKRSEISQNTQALVDPLIKLVFYFLFFHLIICINEEERNPLLFVSVYRRSLSCFIQNFSVILLSSARNQQLVLRYNSKVCRTHSVCKTKTWKNRHRGESFTRVKRTFLLTELGADFVYSFFHARSFLSFSFPLKNFNLICIVEKKTKQISFALSFG